MMYLFQPKSKIRYVQFKPGSKRKIKGTKLPSSNQYDNHRIKLTSNNLEGNYEEKPHNYR